MERKIGEIFEYKGEWHQCVESDGTCNGCVGTFQSYSFCNDFEECVGKIFKKLEKVGEPYEFDGHLFQSYRTFEVPIFTENYATVRELGNNSKISIEIKQNKEDMEEKKQCGDNRFRAIARAKEHLFQATNIAENKKELEVLDSFLIRCWQMGWLKQYEDIEEKKSNLSPFDIQKAREGKPVCTRDGRKARIICFDQKDIAPIVGLVTGLDGKESIYAFYKDGRVSSQKERVDDLMMLPEKKEGWVNVYKDSVYDTKDDALIGRSEIRGYIDTIKISWEE